MLIEITLHIFWWAPRLTNQALEEFNVVADSVTMVKYVPFSFACKAIINSWYTEKQFDEGDYLPVHACR